MNNKQSCSVFLERDQGQESNRLLPFVVISEYELVMCDARYYVYDLSLIPISVSFVDF